jgi:hypothetical protein
MTTYLSEVEEPPGAVLKVAGEQSPEEAVPRREALADYETSPRFGEAEQAGLDYATELTSNQEVSLETFARLASHYREREICDIVWVVASLAPLQSDHHRAEHRPDPSPSRRRARRPAAPAGRGPRLRSQAQIPMR